MRRVSFFGTPFFEEMIFRLKFFSDCCKIKIGFKQNRGALMLRGNVVPTL